MPHRRFQFLQALPAYDLELFHPVLPPVLHQRLQLMDIFLMKRQHQRSVVLIIEIKFFRQLRIHPVSKQVVLCHQRAVGGVKTGVNDR